MNLFDGLEGESRWEEIGEELDEFQSFLSTKIPKLIIERQLDVLNWETQHGVYLLFDDKEQLLYLGYTLVGFKNRISNHKQQFDFKWIDLIKFQENFEFLAPALEIFLRPRLKPILDAGGKHV